MPSINVPSTGDAVDIKFGNLRARDNTETKRTTAKDPNL